MKRLFLATLIVTGIPIAAAAQPARSCDTRPGLAASAGLLILDFEVDPEVAGVGRFGLAATDGTGLEGAITGVVPIAPTWALSAEIAAGTMAVVTTRDEAGVYQSVRTGDDVTVQRLQVGLRRRRLDHYGWCRYEELALGLYRYSYRGVAVGVPAGAVMMGFELPSTERGALFFEIGMSVALTRYDTPTAASLAVNIRPAIGWIYRF